MLDCSFSLVRCSITDLTMLQALVSPASSAASAAQSRFWIHQHCRLVHWLAWPATNQCSVPKSAVSQKQCRPVLEAFAASTICSPMPITTTSSQEPDMILEQKKYRLYHP